MTIREESKMTRAADRQKSSEGVGIAPTRDAVAKEGNLAVVTRLATKAHGQILITREATLDHAALFDADILGEAEGFFAHMRWQGNEVGGDVKPLSDRQG